MVLKVIVQLLLCHTNFTVMKKKQQRLSKEAWLRTSLDILAEEGEQKLTIDHLVKAMGVTKGSFYWHFKNRAEYIRELVCFWADFHTRAIVHELNLILDPAKRLLRLMVILTEENQSRYDISIMNWGKREPVAQQKLQDVFNMRMQFIRSIFKELGFEGDELEMRVQTMVFFQTMESSQYALLSKKIRLRHVKLRHKMLTRT